MCALGNSGHWIIHNYAGYSVQGCWIRSDSQYTLPFLFRFDNYDSHVTVMQWGGAQLPPLIIMSMYCISHIVVLLMYPHVSPMYLGTCPLLTIQNSCDIRDEYRLITPTPSHFKFFNPGEKSIIIALSQQFWGGMWWWGVMVIISIIT